MLPPRSCRPRLLAAHLARSLCLAAGCGALGLPCAALRAAPGPVAALAPALASAPTAGPTLNLAGKIVHLTLDPEQVCAVAVSEDAITTISFPDNIAGIDGAGFADSPDAARRAGAGFLLAHRAGTRYLTVRALRPGAKGTLNVQVGQNLLTLYCGQSQEAPWRVILDAALPAAAVVPVGSDTGPAPAVDPGDLQSALGRFRTELTRNGVSAALNDETGRPLPSAELGTEARCGAVASRIVRAVRDEARDTLFFAVELHNEGAEPYCYDPDGFGVRLPDGVTLPQSASLANGLLGAGRTDTVYFAVTGRPDGRRNNAQPGAVFAVCARAIRFEGAKLPDHPVAAARREHPRAANKTAVRPALPVAKLADARKASGSQNAVAVASAGPNAPAH